jgi:hypothetical protein
MPVANRNVETERQQLLRTGTEPLLSPFRGTENHRETRADVAQAVEQ